ncbi:hypothetical protein D3C71_1825900 [compost metagenome]
MALAHDLVGNDVAIQRQFHCGSHPGIGKRRALVVNLVIKSAQVRVNVQLLRDLAFHFREQVRRDGAVGDIDFTAAEAVDVTDL